MPSATHAFANVPGGRYFALVLASFIIFAFSIIGTNDIRLPVEGLIRRDDSYHSSDATLDTFAYNATSLLRRDDYSCSASAPCSNGACCGASGYCGYGPTYCGKGCQSNCDAHAECGQYAVNPGQECPLNVCCSQYGFCGTTEDFCDSKCQSNCVLNPSPPGGGASEGIIDNKVIGYYESWSNGKACHNVGPTDLPLDALTHVNYAFAYIDPDSYQIVTMDTSTPASLFDDTTTLKSIKPDIKVWVSVGGWSFSDNGTATQPLFGEIAADAGKRQKFANNVVHFLQQHGFDGIDIDWEYPGAPDRGGQKQDTANYVQLLETLRSTFDGSGGEYGISFTIPSSYWYLRWFDLPNMVKYADWINFMTYDLHGVWDATNPIGSIVQGHTNLTEIKLATNLLWRVNIPPAKIVLGFGFYGRSFTLADPSCSQPGCPFSGASNPGPCTATGGILGYYEIQQILKNGPKPVHDAHDAVNYLVFDNNQWVSYDDATTFKQKVDWANSVGLGGALIWASDLDDDQYSAHSALLGRTVHSTSSLQDTEDLLHQAEQLSITENVQGQTGEKCFKYSGKCVNLNDNKAMAAACGPGNTVVGWDDAGCGKKNCHCGKPICCPTLGAPTKCTWRGDNTGGVSGDCSGECYEGEINVAGIGSSWGGGFTNDGNTNKCRRGYKSFCCTSPDYSAITKTCSFTSCAGSCSSGQTPMFEFYSDCWFGRYKTYCCPDPAPVSDCHWVGDGGDCKNVHCASNEIELAKDPYGDPNTDSWACSWGRDKAACCKIDKVTTKPAPCATDLCKLFPGYCPSDDDDESADNWSKRDLNYGVEALAKRGGLVEYTPPPGSGGPQVIVKAPGYPGPTRLYGTRLATQAIPLAVRLTVQYCFGPSVSSQTFSVPNPPDSLIRSTLQTEHLIDKQVIASSFVVSMFTGILPSGNRARLATVGQSFFDKWNTANAALGRFARIGGPYGPQPDTINGRVMHVLGSYGYRAPFSLIEAAINGAKGRMFGLRKSATDLTIIQNLATEAMKLDSTEAADKLLSSIRIGFAVFETVNLPALAQRWAVVNNQMRLQLGFIEQVTGINILVNWWDVWFADWSVTVGTKAQQWAYRAITIATQAVYDAGKAASDAGRPAPEISAMVTAQLGQFADQIKNMVVPSLPQVPLLPPPGGSKMAIRDDEWLNTEDMELLTRELDEDFWERMMRS